jgi:hypothetical protein
MQYQPKAGFSRYIESIAELMPSHGSGHVAYAYHQNYENLPQQANDSSAFIRKLWESVPIWYYEELLYCAQAYSILFGILFPNLVDHVEELAYTEWLLYTEPENRKYRDHLVHMFKVAYVCQNLVSQKKFLNKIASLQTKSEHFKKWLKNASLENHFNEENSQDLIRIALFISSVFHDFGYGYYFLNSYKRRLHKTNAWLLPGADPTCCDLESTRKLLKSLPAEFVRTYHQNKDKNEATIISGQKIAAFFYNNRLLNHSVASTFFIIDLCEKLYELEAISGPLYIAFQLAAEICMIHDMTGPNKWMDLRPHYKDGSDSHFINKNFQNRIPLSMVFILADELAVWNRPRMRSEHFGNDSVLQTVPRRDPPGADNIEIKLSYSPSQIVINASNSEDRRDISKAIQKLKFLKDKTGKPKILGYEIIIPE